MHRDNVFPRLLSSALVVALAVGLGLLLDPVASGEPPAGSLGSLTVSPAAVTDLEIVITFLLTPTAMPDGAIPTSSPGTSNSADTSTPSGPSAEMSSLTSTDTLANTGAPITLLLLGGLILLAAGLVVMLTAARIASPRHRGGLPGRSGDAPKR